MNHQYTSEEKKYLESFKDTTLNISGFHHKQHVLVTYVLLIENNIDETYLCIKQSILAVLNHVGVDTTKYHETMTYAWVLIVKHFMQKTQKCDSFESFIHKNPELLDIQILYKHYSKTLIHSEKSRLKICKADISPIF